MENKAADLTIRRFYERIADPDVFSGGGSVAAITAAGAAATALLVMRLNLKRRANEPHRQAIQEAIDRTTAAIEDFYDAAADDTIVLDELLEAQRAAKSGGGRERYLAALVAAAESPLRLGERIMELIDTVESQIPLSTRFTVSDLGAAAVVAAGACRAALLTAEVNIALLNDTEGSNGRVVAELEERRKEKLASIGEAAERIEATTRQIILKQDRKGTRGR